MSPSSLFNLMITTYLICQRIILSRKPYRDFWAGSPKFILSAVRPDDSSKQWKLKQVLDQGKVCEADSLTVPLGIIALATSVIPDLAPPPGRGKKPHGRGSATVEGENRGVGERGQDNNGGEDGGQSDRDEDGVEEGAQGDSSGVAGNTAGADDAGQGSAVNEARENGGSGFFDGGRNGALRQPLVKMVRRTKPKAGRPPATPLRLFNPP
ncbi:MAG: hypothetical protein Q9209_005773 [Squamulea sp. 1 TL-2023]